MDAWKKITVDTTEISYLRRGQYCETYQQRGQEVRNRFNAAAGFARETSRNVHDLCEGLSNGKFNVCIAATSVPLEDFEHVLLLALKSPKTMLFVDG